LHRGQLRELQCRKPLVGGGLPPPRDGRNLFTIGDSITAGGTDEIDGLGWPYHLRQELDNAQADYWWQEKPVRFAAGGETVATIKAGIDAYLATVSDVPYYALILLGANDIGAGWDNLTEASWKADYRYILDALRAKWPSVLIYLGKSFRDGAGEEAKLAILAGWIDDLVAENPSYLFNTFNSMDFLDGHPELFPEGDNVHPNHAGMIVMAQYWLTALGY